MNYVLIVYMSDIIIKGACIKLIIVCAYPPPQLLETMNRH